VCGVGINDSESPILKRVLIDGRETRWKCPYYVKWNNMMERGYSAKCKAQRPHYQDVTVCPEWHLFSNFRSWMQQQDWEGKSLDKDLLAPGNRMYSPQHCCFISNSVNSFLTNSAKSRGEWPQGVYFEQYQKRFRATICIGQGKQKNLGNYTSPEEAHKAWLKAKIALADVLADQECDQRIANALRNYYREYVDPWFADQELPLAA
jgi:hypothetical protein